MQIDHVLKDTPLIGITVALQIVADSRVHDVTLSTRLQEILALDVIAPNRIEEIRLIKRPHVCVNSTVRSLDAVSSQRSGNTVDRILVTDIVCKEAACPLQQIRACELSAATPAIALENIPDDDRLVQGSTVGPMRCLIRRTQGQVWQPSVTTIAIEQAGSRAKRAIRQLEDIHPSRSARGQ